MIPAANDSTGSVFNAAPSQPTNWREELARVDWNVTQKHRATFRYIHDSWSTVTPTVLPWGAVTSSFPTIQTQFSGPGESMVAKLVSTFSPTLLNEFVASFTTDKISLSNTGPWARPSSFTAGQLFPDNGGKLPGVTLSSNGAYNSGFSEDPSFIPQGKYNSNPTYTLRDNVTKNMGKHNVQFGAYFVAAEKNELFSGQNNGLLTFDSTAPNSTGNPFADLLMGNIANFTQVSAQPKYYNRYKILEPYLQDDWRITNKLTLNLGLRVSLFGTYREIKHQAYNFEPSAWDPNNTSDPTNGIVQCGVGGVPAGCMTGHLFNPAPRIGFAYDPFGDGKTSIRAAYGIFYEHTNGNEGNSESLEGSAPLVLNPTVFTINGYDNIGGTGSLPPLSVTSIPTKAVWPYMQQWHLDIQRDLFRNTVATISYVGTKGTHLTLQRDLNQLYPVSASQNPFQPGQPLDGTICTPDANGIYTVNGVQIAQGSPIYGNLSTACGNDPSPYRTNFPGYATITGIEPTANSNYNALQVSARRTQGRLSLSLAYTWSHSLDDASDRYDSNFVNSYNPHGNYASSNFDQRQTMTASWVYDLPGFKGSGFKQNILGGWEYSGIFVAQTGTPFSVLDGIFSDTAGLGNGNSSGSFADVVGNPHTVSGPLYSSDPTIKGPLLFNPAAFAETTGLTQGNSGRNFLYNPGRWNFDMAMYKNFKLNERFNLEFRTEAFNVFNHTQWVAGSVANGGGVQNTLGSGDQFLRPTGAHDPRIMQFALKLGF